MPRSRHGGRGGKRRELKGRGGDQGANKVPTAKGRVRAIGADRKDGSGTQTSRAARALQELQVPLHPSPPVCSVCQIRRTQVVGSPFVTRSLAPTFLLQTQFESINSIELLLLLLYHSRGSRAVLCSCSCLCFFCGTVPATTRSSARLPVRPSVSLLCFDKFTLFSSHRTGSSCFVSLKVSHFTFCSLFRGRKTGNCKSIIHPSTPSTTESSVCPAEPLPFGTCYE